MISQRDKIQIIKSEIAALERQKYQLELQCKVFKKTGQEQRLESASNMLVETEAQIDFYQEELKNIEKQK